MKFAILFPGQGSQKVGMGLDLFEKTNTAKELFQTCNNICKKELSKIFLHGPEEELNQTINTQPAIVTVSCALTLLLQEKLKDKNLKFTPFACSGHSLGEFTALWFLKILSFEDLIKLVSIRGKLMQDTPKGKSKGSMAAILNLSKEKIEEIISEKSEKGEKNYKNKIVIANYNTPSQFVISGEKELLQDLVEKIKLNNGKAIILPVSGAFHSPLMEEPSQLFSLELDKILPKSINNIPIDLYQNCDGMPSKDYLQIKEKIKKQMTSSVYWTQTITNLVKDGLNAVIEIGPGKVLTGLVKKINPNIDCYNIFDLASLEEFTNDYEYKFQSKEHSKIT